jgi:hypothetical protein
MSRALHRGVIAVVLAATALTFPRAASADQQSSVQAQIAALQDQVVATGRAVHDLTAAYGAAQVDVSVLGQQITVETRQAAQAARSVALAGAALRNEAVGAYIGGYGQAGGAGTSATSAANTAGGVADPATRFEYLSVATSLTQDSLDRYRTSRLTLTSALGTLMAEEDAARGAAASAARARQAALADAVQANARLVTLQVQMANLQQQAAALAAAGNAPVTDASATRAPTQGGPVNGGLVAVVRSEVAASPVAPVGGPPPLAPSRSVLSTPLSSTTVPAPSTTSLPSAPAPPTTVPADPPAASTQGGAGGVWLQLRQCESGDDYQADTGNGFYGAYQFSQPTWTDLGYPGRPDLEPPAMQDQAAMQLQAQSGWGQWPACAAALGLS